MIDLTKLPAPDVVERLDYEEILAQLVADYQARWPEFSAFVESEPALKLLDAFAYREMLVRARVNDGARAVMLAHAEAADLDNLAVAFGVARLPGEADDALRQRVVRSLGAHNTAGSQAGYEYWARSVAGVGVVCATRKAPGVVRIVVGGDVTGEGAAALDAQPSKAVYDAVVAQFARADVRPITDTVEVDALWIRAYRVRATLTLEAGVVAAEAIAAATASVRAYCLRIHRCSPPDNTVRRNAIVSALFVAGVADVALTEPAADVPSGDGHPAPWPTRAVPAGTVYPAVTGPGRNEPAADPVRRPMDGIAVTVA